MHIKEVKGLHIVSFFVMYTILACVLLSPVSAGDYVPGEVIVVFDDSAMAFSDIVEKCGGSVIDIADNAVLVRVAEGTEASFISRAMKIASVRYAERNGVVHALWTPNDPDWSSQWAPKAICADKAWDIVNGSESIKIAIVDTGVDYNHEDLRDNYDDSGYDWVNNDDDPMDDNGHGTHCAGIASAVMDNGLGIAGVSQVKIMAEKVLNRWGIGSTWNVVRGIVHAVQSDAKIISMSLGSHTPSKTLRKACLYAWKEGCILVAAAGNDGRRGICYPAKFRTVICVGAIDEKNKRCSFSNYGAQMELVAPGEHILSTYPDDKYVYMSGTSMATPFVAGVAALVWSQNASLRNQDVRKILARTADDLGNAGWDIEYGFGRVDADEALATACTLSVSQTQQPLAASAR